MYAPCERARPGRRIANAQIWIAAAVLMAASAADASELADRHRAICRGDTNYSVHLTGVARDTDTCASRNACFSYILKCSDGRQYPLKWYLNPQSLPHEEFYAQHYPIFQTAIFAMLLLYVAVARASGRHVAVPFFFTLWAPLSIIGLVLFASDVPARYSTQAGTMQFIWTGPIRLLLLSVTYVGIPGFLLCLLVPFLCGIPRVISGLDFMLRKHPAEPVVLSALRNGKAIDTGAVVNALMPEPGDLGARRPVFRSKNQAARARAAKEKLDADAALAEAVERRERARAALLRAKRDLREAKRRGGSHAG
jgi:hypothetical protein